MSMHILMYLFYSCYLVAQGVGAIEGEKLGLPTGGKLQEKGQPQ